MNDKLIEFDDKARQKLMEGINIVAKAVGSTLGPRSRNVALDQYGGTDLPPTILHDGVSVARAINLKDPHADMGARLLKNVAIKTNEIAGDGTTTATVLTQAIIQESLKAVASGYNPMLLKQEIELAGVIVLANLEKLAKKISKEEEKEQIATISSSDQYIGKLVATALAKVGNNGVLTVEEGRGFETTIEYKQGMEIDRGYLSPYFKTDEEKGEAVIEEPFILLSDKKFNDQYELAPFLNKFLQESKSKNLVIFASEVAEEGMATLVINKLNGNLNVVAIQAPAFGDRRMEELEDIAILTGGHPILIDSGRELKSIEITELGRADKVVVSQNKTVIVNGRGNKKAIEKRINDLDSLIKRATTDYDREQKEQRLANLAGKIAVINVGAATEIELKEKKERVIDAVNATKAAIEEGIVAGGEITYYYLASKAPEMAQKAFSTIGGHIIHESLKKPLKKILENSGFDYAEKLKELSGKEYPFGIDVIDGEIKDMIETGIIDPVKVTRSALENAISIATMIITTDTLITDLPEEVK